MSEVRENTHLQSLSVRIVDCNAAKGLETEVSLIRKQEDRYYRPSFLVGIRHEGVGRLSQLIEMTQDEIEALVMLYMRSRIPLAA